MLVAVVCGSARQCGKKWLFSECIWKVKATDHADGLFLEHERKERIKDDLILKIWPEKLDM